MAVGFRIGLGWLHGWFDALFAQALAGLEVHSSLRFQGQHGEAGFVALRKFPWLASKNQPERSPTRKVMKVPPGAP